MVEFLRSAALLLLALALSSAVAYIAQDRLGEWLRASEEWAVMPHFLAAWATLVMSTLGIGRCLTRTVVALVRAAIVLCSLVLAGTIAMIALQAYVEPSLLDQTLLLLHAAIMALMLLVVGIQWGVLRWPQSRQQVEQG